MKELKQNEDIIQLLYIAEQYLGKTLTPTETRKILFFYDELHMSVDLIDYLIEYCVGRDHRSIRYIETVAMAWKEEGITTVEMAKDSTSRYSKEYYSVLKAMGIANRNPSDAEISLINTWTRDYGFAMELIQEPAHGQFCRLDSQVFHMQTKFCSAGRIKTSALWGTSVFRMPSTRSASWKKQCRRQTSRNPQPQTALTISISVTTILLNMRRNCLTNQIKSWKQIFI